MSTPTPTGASTRLDDLYDERSNRRLLVVVRTLIVCSVFSIPSPVPGFSQPWPMPLISVGVITSLTSLSLVYAFVLLAARWQRWRLARDVLFGGWSLYPASLVLMYHPEASGIVQVLVLGLADLFAVLVVVGMVVLAPWKQARVWVAIEMMAMSVAFMVVGGLWDHPLLVGYVSFALTSLALLGGTVLPLWTILTDLDGALRQSDAARQEAQALRAQAAHARDEALAASRAKSSFLANMSHELRTPLNAILGYAELIKEDAESSQIGDFDDDLDRIRAAGIHLLGLIDSVLDLSKIEAGKVEVSPSRFDVRTPLEEAVSTVRPLATAKALELRVDLGPVPDMWSDPHKIRQVLLNLLSNAVKYTDQGTIVVRAAAETHQLILEVTDTGAGIEPERLETVFDAFERTDAEITRRVGGTGLGLAISRRLCQLLGGTLLVKSTIGEGSTFSMHLPLQWAGSPPPQDCG